MTALSRALLLSVGGVALVGTLGVGAAYASGDGVPRGVRVAGTDVGGLSGERALAAVQQAVQPRATAPMTVLVDGVEKTLDPATSGLAPDVTAMVQEAADAGPIDRLRGLVGARRDVQPVAAVDGDALRAAMTRLKATVDRAPSEGAVRFRGATPYAVPPVTGRDLDLEGSVEAVAQAYLRGTEPVELPVAVTPVKSTGAGVLAALRQVAEPAVAAPVRLDVGGRPLVVDPVHIAAGLALEAGPTGALTPQVDGAKVLKALSDRVEDVQQAPVDARIELVDGAPVVVPSKDGRSVTPTALSKALLPVLTRTAPRTAPLALAVEQPELTTKEAQALRVVEQIGTFTTRHPCCAGRVTNIHRIADLVDGTLVLPGEQFDLNAAVGPRDRARGFVEAPQILEGQFVDRVGGGVSQFATTLFNAVFFSGMKDITHSPHSYYISRYPPGREATVSFPEPDLVFQNDSPHGLLIDTSYTGTSITVTFWGTKRFDVESVTGPRTRLRPFATEYVQRDDCTATAGEEGFDIDVTRVFKKGGAVVKREVFETRYKPEPRFICGPPPSASPRTPERSASPSPAASAPPPAPAG